MGPARRVLITGAAGFLGQAVRRLAPPETELHGTQHHTPVRDVVAHPVDLADADAVRRTWERARPDLVLHTAYSMIHGLRDIVVATANVAAACAEFGVALIHLSTDLVFNGEDGPYDEAARIAPTNDYARWKAEAEAVVRGQLPGAAIVRTSLVTWFTPLDPRSAWVAGALREEKPVSLFVDEIRCPIRLDDLARQIWELAALDSERRAGVWHLAGPEALSRYALGLLIAAHQRLDPRGIVPARSADSPEPRPRDVRLLTPRAEQNLHTPARPISSLLLPGAGTAEPPPANGASSPGGLQ